MLSNPDHVSSAEEDAIVDSIVNENIPEADFYSVDEGDLDQNSDHEDDSTTNEAADDDTIG